MCVRDETAEKSKCTLLGPGLAASMGTVVACVVWLGQSPSAAGGSRDRLAPAVLTTTVATTPPTTTTAMLTGTTATTTATPKKQQKPLDKTFTFDAHIFLEVLVSYEAPRVELPGVWPELELVDLSKCLVAEEHVSLPDLEYFEPPVPKNEIQQGQIR